MRCAQQQQQQQNRGIAIEQHLHHRTPKTHTRKLTTWLCVTIEWVKLGATPSRCIVPNIAEQYLKDSARVVFSFGDKKVKKNHYTTYANHHAHGFNLCHRSPDIITNNREHRGRKKTVHKQLTNSTAG